MEDIVPKPLMYAMPERVKQCARCEHWFVSLRSDHIFCSTRCRARDYRERGMTGRGVRKLRKNTVNNDGNN